MRELSPPEFFFFMSTNLIAVGGTVLLWLFLGRDQVEDLNPILVSLATLQVFLIVVAIFGYWAIRGAAERQAIDEVRTVVPQLVSDEVARHMEDLKPILRRDVRNFDATGEDDSNNMDDVLDSLV